MALAVFFVGDGVAITDTVQTPKILVVDDHEVNRIVLREILRRQGYAIIEAGDGEGGRELAVTQKPDLILLDIMMPGEDGIETCRRLKSDSATADMPVIFVSALTTVEKKVEGLEAGAVDYIIKPFHAVEVVARVRLHLRLAMANRRLVALEAQRLSELAEAQLEILIDDGDLPEARFAVAHRAMAQAGGDFYDVISLGSGRYCYFIADVSGHGIKASFITAALKALVRQNVTTVNTPVETLKIMNSVLCNILGSGNHITACLVLANRETRRFEVVCSGHPQAIWLSGDGTVRRLGEPGEPLGIFPTIVLTPAQATASVGDRLMLFTDGLLNNGNLKRSVQEADLARAIEKSGSRPLAEAVEEVFAQFSSSEDDSTLMGIEF